MNVKLYSLKDPRTKEIKYIGISVNPKRRYRQHLNCTINLDKFNWINSLKIKNLLPEMEILFESDDVNFILNKEIELIKKYNNLLNISKGGEFNLAYSFGNRKVKMYNLDGELLKIFSSNAEALRDLNINDTSGLISACALRKRNHAHGYIWRYDDDIITEDDIIRFNNAIENSRNNKHVFVFNFDGIFINDYESIEQCAKDLGIGRSGISGVLNSKNNFSHKGYIFATSFEDFENKYDEYLNTLPKSVVQYDLCGNVVNYFKSVNAVATYFNTSCNNSIKKCCEGKIDSYKDFIFKYEQIVPSKFNKIIIHFNVTNNNNEIVYNGSTETDIRIRINQIIKNYPEFINFNLNIVNGSTLAIKDLIENYEAKPNTQKPIKCLENNIIYSSCRKASIDLNINASSITQYLKGKQKSKIKGLYSFEYVPTN